MDLRESGREASITHKTNSPPRRLIGDLLIRRGQIRRYQLEFVLDLQKAYRKKNIPLRVGDLLVDHRAIQRQIVEAAAFIQSEIPLDSVTDIVKQFENQEPSSPTKLITSPEPKSD